MPPPSENPGAGVAAEATGGHPTTPQPHHSKPRERAAGPTKAQLRVLQALAFWTQRQPVPPTLRELAVEVGLRSPAGVYQHLEQLHGLELIDWDGRKARSFRLTDAGWRVIWPALLRPGASLLERTLAVKIPGALLACDGPAKSAEEWRVKRGQQVLGFGSTAREAVDRALFLWGSR